MDDSKKLGIIAPEELHSAKTPASAAAGQSSQKAPQSTAVPEPPAQTPPTSPESQPGAAAQVTTPAAQPAPSQPSPPTPKFPEPQSIEIDSDTQTVVINKSFVTSFSPRFFYYPFSFDIDVQRAVQSAVKKGYQVPDNPMILDTGGMFWAKIMVEVVNPSSNDSSIKLLQNATFKTHLFQRPWPQMKAELSEIEKELQKNIEEKYVYHAEDKKIILAR